MRAVQVVRHGAPVDAVEVREVPVPEPGPGLVRIAVRAASVNFGDIARARGGVASVNARPPFTLGMDACGTVDAVGDGVDLAIGTPVTAITAMALGGMAEYALAPAHSALPVPAGLDPAEAAGFLLPFHVAQLALHRRAALQPGERLLVTGGASGVGTAAIQLGVAAGAEVIALAGGAAKLEQCRSLGATHLIDHTTDDVFDAVMAATDGHGADVVCDLVGGDLTETLWTCVAREGRYLPVGFNDDPQSGLTGRPLRKVSMGNFSVVGVMLSYNHAPPQLRRLGLDPFPPSTGATVHAALCDLVAAGHVRPVIGRRIAMEQVGAALADHEARRTTGRTVVEIGGAA
jgi:NADPH2:quinone reductase